MSPRPRNAAGPASTTFIVTLQRRMSAVTLHREDLEAAPEEPGHHRRHFLIEGHLVSRPECKRGLHGHPLAVTVRSGPRHTRPAMITVREARLIARFST